MESVYVVSIDVEVFFPSVHNMQYVPIKCDERSFRNTVQTFVLFSALLNCDRMVL